MPATSSRGKMGANERSSLLENEITDSHPSFAKDSLRRRSSTLLNEATKAERFRAIRICYFGMFVSSIVFSITVASLWPFLQIVDTTAEATFLGWLVASFSLGQLIASPLIGYIANRTDKNKSPLVISTALIAISNVHYAYVESFNNFLVSNKWWLMLSRFIMGIGAANSTIMRSYASSATTMAERTAVMANMSAYQGIGFILGPLIQALFASIGYPGLVHSSWLHLNIYTAPAFFSAITAVINVFLFMGPFKDVRVVTSPRRSINKGPQKPTSVSSDDRQQESIAIICCLYLFFVAYLTFTNYETIASPLSIDMYAWSKEESTRNNGYLLGGLGLMSVVVLIVTKILAKRFQDRLLMLGGMCVCFLGYFVFLPWGDDYPSVQIASNVSSRFSSSLSLSMRCLVASALPTAPSTAPTVTMIMNSTTTPAPDSGDKGCPLDYDWCYNVPRVQLAQYILASIVITAGFTVGNVICYSIFSKKLGDRPQGTMMGLFTSAGSLARAFGPIAVGFLYKHWGPRAMMIFMLIIVATAIAAILFNYKRLYIEPEEPDDSDESDAEDNPIVNS